MMNNHFYNLVYNILKNIDFNNSNLKNIDFNVNSNLKI